jgi:hypothetical protein
MSERKPIDDAEWKRLERVTAEILFPDLFKKRTRKQLFESEEEEFEAEERKAIMTE